jgi:hypothetical protein
MQSKNKKLLVLSYNYFLRHRRGRDRMVVGFITTYAISTYQSITTNIVSSNPAQARCAQYNIML